MKVLVDIFLRTLYMSLFIILIPLGAYTIHNGSSATVALFSYVVLSVGIPVLYMTSKISGFGPKEHRINRFLYVVSWLLVEFATYHSFFAVDLSLLWTLPNVGRDIIFVLLMYVQVFFSVILAYILTSIKRGVCR